MSMKNYCFHSILMLYWVLSFCTFGDVVRTIEITKIEMPPNITFSFPCETKIEDCASPLGWTTFIKRLV